ncbi:helix-loop-helix protein lin-22-like [Diorhabda sublineata]|uniref:helix-loop-helix protein lin-22-like n=1 Tax=Diorhabda sublineata TaxID=1163346 RepID=UPI0024E0FE01|nr:helix-loop-helix protein lin-22-like [Diorhabda sublineata]
MKTNIKKQPSESRKIRKPMMEKKRRARINDSLETLKQILLESKTSFKEIKKGQRTSKLEKADILEMTVQYLQQLQEQNKENHPDVKSKKEETSKKEPVLIRPADSSSEIAKMSVTSGQIVYLLPQSLKINVLGNYCSEKKSKMWRPW